MPTPSRRSHTRPRILLLLLTALLLCAAARSQDLGGSTGERVKSAGSGKPAGHSQRSHTGRNQPSQNSKMNAVLEDALKHGEEELNASHFSEAEYAYKPATMLNDKDGRGYGGLGDVYYDQKKYDEAEKNYRLAFALADEKNKPYTELGSTALAQRRYSEASDLLRKALALDPDDTSALVAYGDALVKLGQPDLAAAQYARAVGLDRSLATAHSGLAMIHFAKGEGAKAREHWNEVARLNAATARDRAGLLVLDGKYGEAAEQLEQYTRANAGDEGGWLMLSDIRRALGDADGASAAHTRAASTAPEYAKLSRPSLPPPGGALAVRGRAGANVSVAPLGGGEGRRGPLAAGSALNFGDLRPGRYRVSARLEGYEPSEREVSVAAGATAAASLEMRPLPSTKSLLAGWADSSGWAMPSGWGVGAHALSTGGEGVAFPSDAGFRNYGDFTLSSDVRMLNGLGVSFALRAADERDYFLVELTGAQSNEPYSLRGFAVANGVRTQSGASIPVGQTAASAVDGSKFFNVRIDVSGNAAAVAVTNSETGETSKVGTLVIPADVYKSGAVGIAAAGPEKNEVGRFAVYPKEDSGPSNWLRGTVTDRLRGTPVSGALVQVVDKASGSVAARRTGAEGGFTQDWLPPGSYSIRVSAPGFRAKEFEQTLAAVGATTLDPIALDANATPAQPPAPMKIAEAAPASKQTDTATTPSMLKPKFVLSARETKPETVAHVILGATLVTSKGTIQITAPAGTRILVEPKVGKEGWLYTMPAGHQTIYVNLLSMGAYRFAAEMDGQGVTDQEVFVPAGKGGRVGSKSRGK